MPQPLPRVASAEKQADLIAFYKRLQRELLADEAVYFAPPRAFLNAREGDGCGASRIPDQARIRLSEGGIKPQGAVA